MTYVGSRACYRTALELCKVILNLDPKADPLGIILVLDFFALRSNQHNWFLKLYAEWEPTRNLSQLPNFAFSVGVAKFQHAHQRDVREDGRRHAEAMAAADAALQSALIMFPSVLFPLLDKASIEPDTRAAGHAFFLDTPMTPGLEILVKLYVHRSHHIWKDPNLLPWLERNVTAVLDLVDGGKSEAVKEAAVKRKTRYQGTPRNIYRHVIVSDVKEVTSSLPRVGTKKRH